MEISENRKKQIRVIGCVTSGALFLIGVGVIVYSRIKLPYMGKYALGSGFLPFWLGILICILSAIIFVQTLRGKYDQIKDIIPKKKNGLCIILYILISCITVFLLKTLGMHICSFIFLLFTMKLVEGQSWKTSLITAAVGSVAIYLLFDVLFNVNFPVGIFGF